MPRKTDGEKIDEMGRELGALDKLVAVLLERLDKVTETLATLIEAQKETTQAINDLRRDHEKEVAVLKRDLEELRRWTEQNGTAELKTEVGVLKEKSAKMEAAQERMGNRAWSIVPNVVGAVVSGLIAALVAYFVARK